MTNVCNMNKVIASIIAIAMAVPCMAQSQKRLEEQAAREAEQKSPAGVTLTRRAMTQYTAQSVMPTELAWRRDIYRELDLTKEKNAALYYPEEPLGDRVNFFTLVFNLILNGKIQAYEYRLDDNELFTPDNLLDIENMLERFYIDYKNENGKITVLQRDIPSREIGKYYIKESNYLDQMSNYHTRVTAICPVMVENGFGGEPTKKPMFWLNYDEISPYLGQTPVMTSSYNNTSNMSLDDYFVMGCYDGDIYKTSNLRNQPLAEYCETDSALAEERQKIEDQLVGFRKGLWNEDSSETEPDNEKAETPKAKSKTEAKSNAPKSNAPKPEKQREKKQREPRQKSVSSGERIGVHR